MIFEQSENDTLHYIIDYHQNNSPKTPKEVVAHRYAHLITEQEQRTKFVRLYNGLNSVLNVR